MLHLPRLLRRSTEQENAASQPVQPVNSPEILQVVLLRQDENHGVVPVTTARMHLRTGTIERSIYFRFFALRLSLMLEAMRKKRYSNPRIYYPNTRKGKIETSSFILLGFASSVFHAKLCIE